MKRFSIVILIGLVIGLFTLNSCQKENLSQTDQDAVEAVISVDNALSDGVSVASTEATETKVTLDDSTTSCYTVERNIDWTNKVGTITVTFNGDCYDGIYRSGTMTITWDLGWRFNPDGKSVVITYENFVRHDKIFNGTISMQTSLVQDSTADTLVPVLNVTLDNFSVTFPDSTSFVINGTKEIKYISGFFTFFNRTDDVLLINSNIEGTSREGVNFKSIGQDLKIDKSCNSFFPVSGTKTITLDDGTTYLIDFGDGSCDLTYTVTVNGVTTTYIWGEENND